MRAKRVPGKGWLRYLPAAALLSLVFALATGAGCLNQAFTPDGTIIYPAIQPVDAGGATLNPSWSFPFEARTVTLTVPVDAGVYQGAAATESGVRVIGNVSDEVWIPGIYRHMIDDPAQDAFFRNLVGAFREIRTSLSLDNDEYLELMAAFVQSETYEIRDRSDPRFPVETYVEGSGDCDDKSILLAGLLSREGYRVALLVFEPESHMALGIADGTSGYADTGYAYLETTTTSLVGITPDTLRGNITLTSQPLVIPIGNGTRIYTRTNETRYIEDALKKADARAKELEPDVASRETSLTAERDALDAVSRELAGLRTSGQYSEYNSRVAEYNGRVSRYNTDLAAYRTLAAQYNEAAGIHNYIVTHLTDRKGAYAWVVNATKG